MGENFKNIAVMACLKSLLMVFNFIFWLSGISILAVGIWMEVDLYRYLELSTEYSDSASYVVIITGACIFLIGSFACCYTMKGQPTMLYIYAAFLAVTFILELGCAISIYAYRAKLSQGIDNGLHEAMLKYRNTTHIAEDFDNMQKTLHCCGNHNPTEWLSIAPQRFPKSCCVVQNCDTRDDSQIYKEGCYDKVLNFIDSNIDMIAVVALCVSFFPLIGMFLSCCLAHLANKHKYEQMA